MKPPVDAEIYDLPTTTVWIDQSGIYCAVSKKEAARTLETAKETLEEFKRIAGDNKVCVLIDATYAQSSSREVREYVAEEFPRMFKAIAIISRSTLGKMVANIFFTIKSQPYPIKIFNDEAKARIWLKQFL
ncbi:MAG: STAS/SEC14 domain-containing protein [Balneolales bacterium]